MLAVYLFAFWSASVCALIGHKLERMPIIDRPFSMGPIRTLSVITGWLGVFLLGYGAWVLSWWAPLLAIGLLVTAVPITAGYSLKSTKAPGIGLLFGMVSLTAVAALMFS
jgi:hypothetical protein